MRTALDGDLTAAGELYQRSAAGLNWLGLREHGAGVSILGRFALLVMQDRVTEIASELESLNNDIPLAPTVLGEPYALALAASGRTAEARAATGRPLPIRQDHLWLFMTGVRGLLAVAEKRQQSITI